MTLALAGRFLSSVRAGSAEREGQFELRGQGNSHSLKRIEDAVQAQAIPRGGLLLG